MFSSLYYQIRKKVTPIHIALTWCAGLAFGFFLASMQSDIVSSLMPAVCLSRVSIVGGAVVLFLPFLIVYLCYLGSVPALALPMLFLKALSFSYCSTGVVYAFHDAAWLIRLFLMFSDIIGVVVLMLYAFRHYSCRSGFKHESMYFFLVLLFTGCIDYLFISPFLMRFMYQL